VAVEVQSIGNAAERRLIFRLNTETLVEAGPAHPLRVDVSADGTPRPYLLVREGLEALVVRSVFYELAEFALAEDREAPHLWSDGARFPFGQG
jgi:hypothetical protein